MCIAGLYNGNHVHYFFGANRGPDCKKKELPIYVVNYWWVQLFIHGNSFILQQHGTRAEVKATKHCEKSVVSLHADDRDTTGTQQFTHLSPLANPNDWIGLR